MPNANGASVPYQFNKNFFSVINTDAKAYWLGMLAADGCITRRSANLSLKEADAGHVYAFRDALEAEQPVIYYAGMATLIVYSVEFAASLIRLGLTPRKTARLVYPDIPDAMTPAFIRGYFDGDGSIYRSVVKTETRWIAEFCGTEAMIRGAHERLRQLGVHGNVYRVRRKNALWLARYQNMHARQFRDVIYRDAMISLPRKKLLFDGIGDSEYMCRACRSAFSPVRSSQMYCSDRCCMTSFRARHSRLLLSDAANG